MWKLSFCLVAAPKMTLYIALGVLLILGGQLWDDRLRAEFWASVAIYTGVFAGLLMLWPLGPRPAASWRPLLIASAGIRIAVSTAMATALYSTTVPVHKFFWTVFIVASICVCVVEVAILRRALRSTIRFSGAADRSGSRAA